MCYEACAHYDMLHSREHATAVYYMAISGHSIQLEEKAFLEMSIPKSV